MRASQVPETADSLEDDDVYLLETKDKIYLWSGKVTSLYSLMIDKPGLKVPNVGEVPL